MTRTAHTPTSATAAAASRGAVRSILGVCALAIAAVANIIGRRYAGAAWKRTAGSLPA